MRARSHVVLSLFVLANGCSCDEAPGGHGLADGGSFAGTDVEGSDDLPPGTVSLSVEPPLLRLQIDGVTPKSSAFSVYALDADGERTDVTSNARWSLSNATLGSLVESAFTTSMIGGRTTLVAELGGLRAEAEITVELVRDVVLVPIGGAPLPSDPAGVFTGKPEDAARAPELVYPNDDVLLPPNLTRLEVHYRPGSNENDLFVVSVVSPYMFVSFYQRCTRLGEGCLFEPPAELWSQLTAMHRGSAFEIFVRGTDDVGTAVGVSAKVRVQIAPNNVVGGLYYWTTSGGTAIMRVDFNSTNPPERFFPFEGGGCYGCHSVSRNGRRMTFSRNGQWDGRISIVDVGSREFMLEVDDQKREQFQSWSPDSLRFAGVYGDDDPPDTNIRIRSGDDGNMLETIPVADEPTHPDWSPRGDRILFTRVTRHETSQRPGRGGISYVEYTNAWSVPIALIAPEDGKNRYYPAFSPDARFFVYDESICADGTIYDSQCDGDADPVAKIWAMAADGGAPIALDRVNAPGIEDRGTTNLSNTFPKWAPFVDPKNADGTGRLMWFTFSSRRKYGLRSPDGSNQLLWMVAVDPDEIAAGHDGSHAAFALPFQDLTTSNHIAQWTARIVDDTPNGGDGDAGVGSDASCVAIGDPCEPSSDVCCVGECVENGPGLNVCRPNI